MINTIFSSILLGFGFSLGALLGALVWFMSLIALGAGLNRLQEARRESKKKGKLP